MDTEKAENETLFYANTKSAYENTTTEKYKNGKNGHVAEVDHCNGTPASIRRVRCTKKRILKICIISTLTPLVLLGLLIGGYLLYTRLSYNPPPSQYSNMTELESLLSGFGNGTNQTIASNASVNLMEGMVLAPWTDCGSQLATVRGFFVEECPPYGHEKGRCSLPLERDGNIQVVFTTNPGVNIAAPTFIACGKAVYAGTPCRNQPFSRPDPCVDSNIVCPLEAERTYVYKNYGGVHQKDLPITLMFDTVADIYFRLRDPVSKQMIFCVRMPAVVDLAPFGQ